MIYVPVFVRKCCRYTVLKQNINLKKHLDITLVCADLRCTEQLYIKISIVAKNKPDLQNFNLNM